MYYEFGVTSKKNKHKSMWVRPFRVLSEYSNIDLTSGEIIQYT